jgi:hypothetical protein
MSTTVSLPRYTPAGAPTAQYLARLIAKELGRDVSFESHPATGRLVVDLGDADPVAVTKVCEAFIPASVNWAVNN